MTNEEVNELLKENAKWIQNLDDKSLLFTHILETQNKILQELINRLSGLWMK